MSVIVDKIPPKLKPEIQISPADGDGNVVVKNKKKRTYLRLGEQECFLLNKLDGASSYGSIAEDFKQEFDESITCDEIKEFVDTAKKNGLIARRRKSTQESTTTTTAPSNDNAGFVKRNIAAAKKQSILYFRVSLFDPDKTLDRLAPMNRWLFSFELAMVVLLTGVWAIFTTWLNRDVIAAQVISVFSVQALLVVFLTTIVVTVLHEFGHGLACKKYKGEVREMGFLWLFFTPCFYCNVSDAWLLPSRWHRFVISAAGTYIDFLIWIVFVFVWRVTIPGSMINLMALSVVSACGVRVLFNINPLMRLDGYYALSDILGQHNLRRRSRARLMEFVRWILWGAKRPEPVSSGTTLLVYGAACWLFVVCFIGLLGFKLTSWLNSLIGISSVIAGVTFVSVLLRRYFRGSLGEEFREMFKQRKTRLLILLALFAGILCIPLTDRVGGVFQVKPLVHWEVRAPIAGFLREVHVHEGDDVHATQLVARIEVPELTSQIARKHSEIAEVDAVLNRLLAGPRLEEVSEQKLRIERAVSWKKLAAHDLVKAKESFVQELVSLDIRINQAIKELEYRDTIKEQAEQLAQQGGLAGRQLLSVKKNVFDAQAQHDELLSKKRARQAEGVLSYESELARREKELADDRSTLTLLEAGSRHEDVEAQRAKLVRLKEELNHMHEQEKLQVIKCPINGTVITARLTDLIGQYCERGSVICIVEDLDQLEAEIAVAEHDAQILTENQQVLLKPRSLPFVSIKGTVHRIAPATGAEQIPGAKKTVTVYCRIDNEHSELRTGMTGYGRVYFGRRLLGSVIYNRGVRLLRSEFWL